MAGFIGRKIKFYWGGEGPAFEIPGVQEKSVSLNGEPVDLSSDEDNGWRTLATEPGENQIDINLSGVTKDDRLEADWFGGEATRTKPATILYPNGAKITGTFFLVNHKNTGPYKDATTFEAALQNSGEVTRTPGA